MSTIHIGSMSNNGPVQIGDNSMQTNSGNFSYEISHSIHISINEALCGFDEVLELAEKSGVPRQTIGQLKSMKDEIVAESMIPAAEGANVGLARKVGEFVSTFQKVTEGLDQSIEIGRKLSESAMKLVPVILPMVARGLGMQ